MKKRQFVEQANGEEYLHKEVWRVACRQIARAEAEPRGALYDDMVAMVFASHALEGYLNYLGEKIAPEIWKNERKVFARSGLRGKLEALYDACGLQAPNRGQEPYLTIAALKDLRDRIAHPKTHKTSTSQIYEDGREPPMFAESYLERLVSHARALKAMEHVKMVVEELHASARSMFPQAGLDRDGLEGILAARTTSARMID